MRPVNKIPVRLYAFRIGLRLSRSRISPALVQSHSRRSRQSRGVPSSCLSLAVRCQQPPVKFPCSCLSLADLEQRRAACQKQVILVSRGHRQKGSQESSRELSHAPELRLTRGGQESSHELSRRPARVVAYGGLEGSHESSTLLAPKSGGIEDSHETSPTLQSVKDAGGVMRARLPMRPENKIPVRLYALRLILRLSWSRISPAFARSLSRRSRQIR